MIPHVTCLHQRCLFNCAHRHEGMRAVAARLIRSAKALNVSVFGLLNGEGQARDRDRARSALFIRIEGDGVAARAGAGSSGRGGDRNWRSEIPRPARWSITANARAARRPSDWCCRSPDTVVQKRPKGSCLMFSSRSRDESKNAIQISEPWRHGARIRARHSGATIEAALCR